MFNKRSLILLAAALSLTACNLLQESSPSTSASSPSAQNILFETEASFTGALAGAAAYSNLQDCSTPNAPKVCKDSGVAEKIVLAVKGAQISLATAETLILGCSKEQYVAATSTPPTATCGKPVADETAKEQAVTAAKLAVADLTAAIPIIEQTGGI
jgi:hypothetical protein